MKKQFNVYFADRRMNITGMASTTMPNALKIIEDLEVEEIETASTSLDFTISYEKSDEIYRIVDVGYYLLYDTGKGSQKFFTIIRTDKNATDKTMQIYAEEGGLDLLNEIVMPYSADKTYPIKHYVDKILYDTGFSVGINMLGNEIEKKLEWDDKETATKRLLDICKEFDNAEIAFSFNIKNMLVTEKFLHIYKKRGTVTETTLRLDKDVNNIITSKSIENLATALIAEGDTPKDADRPITLDGYKYDDGRFYVKNSHLLDRESIKKWSRYLSPTENGTDRGHIVKHFEYKTDNQAELCEKAVEHLQKISEVEQNFEVDIAKLPDDIKIGDRVNIVDTDGRLYLSARVLRLETSRVEQEATAILGEFLIRTSGISQQLEDLAGKIKDGQDGQDGINGVSCYLTNEAVTVPSDADGYVSSNEYFKMNGRFVVVDGDKEVPPQEITFSSPLALGCVGDIKETGEYSVSNIYNHADAAFLKLKAKYKDMSFDKTFTITKSKNGQDGKHGQDGKPGEVVEVQSSHIGRYPPDRPVKGMVWFQTGLRDGMETVIAIKDYNGYSWIERQINHEPIHIDKLSALTADVGVLTAGAISTPDIYIGITRGQIKIFDTYHDMEAVMENGQLIFKESTGNKKRLTLDKYGIRNEDSYYGKRELNFVPEGLEIRSGTSNTGDRKNSGLELIGDKSYIDFHTGYGTSSLIETDWDARVIAQNRNRSNNEGGALLRSFSYGFDLCVEDDVKVRTLGDRGWNTIRALEFKPNSELKHKNILEKYNSGLVDLRKIDFYEYSRDDGDSRYLGLITDYVKDKLPIIADEEGVSLYSLVSLVGQGLKELDKKTGSYMTFNSMVNDEQNEKIKELERKNNELEERLSKLEALYG